MPERLLLLGGTTEAVGLARALHGEPGIETTYSLAGRTRRPAPIPGAVRTGGFGGLTGLQAYLHAAGISLVVDATHPFADAISAHAAIACERASVPRLVLLREPWRPAPGDRWIVVEDLESAASSLPALGTRVLLTIGSRCLDPFLQVPEITFVVRAIEPPSTSLDARFEVMLARGPFDFSSERRLLQSHAIDVLVSKNSGGVAARAKLDAARELNIPVVMVARPPPPPGETVATVAAAREWIKSHIDMSTHNGHMARV